MPALAQQKTLTVAAYGGVWDTHLRKEVFPEFEKKHGVKIEYVAGNSTDTLAKLQAQKGNQVIDVAIMDDGVDVPGDPARLLRADRRASTRASSIRPRCSRTTRRSPSARPAPAS